MGINENMKKAHLSIFIMNLLKAKQLTVSDSYMNMHVHKYIYLHAYEFILTITDHRQLLRILGSL